MYSISHLVSPTASVPMLDSDYIPCRPTVRRYSQNSNDTNNNISTDRITYTHDYRASYAFNYNRKDEIFSRHPDVSQLNGEGEQSHDSSNNNAKTMTTIPCVHVASNPITIDFVLDCLRNKREQSATIPHTGVNCHDDNDGCETEDYKELIATIALWEMSHQSHY